MERQRIVVCKLKGQGGWYEIAKTGKWKGHNAGEFELTTADLNQIVFNFNNSDLKEVVVDYEHQTLDGVEAPASGWIKELKVESESLLAKIEWTKRAKEQIKNKEYRYLSPVLIANAKDSKSGSSIGWYLHSVALTNTPFFTELNPIEAKNKNQNKESKVSEKELEELRAENKRKEEELKAKEQEIAKLKEEQAKQKVADAIAAKKINKEQETWALKYALADEAGFEEFLKNAKELPEVPESNQFKNSNKPDDGIDVVKIALGDENE